VFVIKTLYLAKIDLHRTVVLCCRNWISRTAKTQVCRKSSSAATRSKN